MPPILNNFPQVLNLFFPSTRLVTLPRLESQNLPNYFTHSCACIHICICLYKLTHTYTHMYTYTYKQDIVLRRSKDELISEVILWTPTHRRVCVRRPAKNYIYSVQIQNATCQEQWVIGMDGERERERERERIRELFCHRYLMIYVYISSSSDDRTAKCYIHQLCVYIYIYNIYRAYECNILPVE